MQDIFDAEIKALGLFFSALTYRARSTLSFLSACQPAYKQKAMLSPSSLIYAFYDHSHG